jgi:sucrose-6-phosphate hydrolase SacC (GH32 family)
MMYGIMYVCTYASPAVDRYNGSHGSVVLYIPEALGAAAADYLPEAGSQFVFRNQTDGSWLMAVGSGRKRDPHRGSMAVLLFSAPDLRPESTWRFVGPMFVGGDLQGGAWCPYFASLDDGDDSTDVMLTMNDYVGRGSLSPPDYRFVPANDSTPFIRLDAGLAHVSAVFVGAEPKNRTSIVMRWLLGAPSCTFIPGALVLDDRQGHGCDPQHAEDVQNAWGWVGVHSLPITVGRAEPSSALANTQGLTFRVVEEVESLRLLHTFQRTPSAAMAAAAAHSPPTVVWHNTVTGVALELRLNFTLPSSSATTVCEAGLMVRATADETEVTKISLRTSDTVELHINRSLATRALNMSMGGGTQVLELPEALLGRAVEVSVYVDRSVVEVFVGDFAIMSTRVYPSAGNLANRVGSFVSSGCTTLRTGLLSSWTMEDVYAAQ